MGVFDSVMVQCPACGKRVEIQSKAGLCVRYVYEADQVPLELQADLKNNPQACQECGTVLHFKVGVVPYVPAPGGSDAETGEHRTDQ